MRRTRGLVIEVLEGKVMPATIAPPIAPVSPAARALNEGLAVRLSTNHQVYRRGEPVVITLTETNTTDQAVTVEQGPSMAGITVSHDGRVIWASNQGVQPMFVLLRTLDPGQSITETTTWNGQSNFGPARAATGRLVIGSQAAGVRPASILIRPH